MPKKHFIFHLFLFTLMCLPNAHAVSIAVFPMEDLSKGLNGVDFELTTRLSDELEKKGLDVIPGDDVVSFLARNRIRRLGVLDTNCILQARDELGADIILVGTSYSSREKMVHPDRGLAVALGLNLFLVRTGDGKIIWSNSTGISGDDEQHLLGLAEPKSKEDLLPLLWRNSLASWPTELSFDNKQQLALEIENVILEPQHLRPGEEVKCKVRLRPTWNSADLPKVYFKVRGHVYLASESYEANIFEASWPASDRDGNYPITLVLNWPSGRKKVAYLGSYLVDSRPPRISLDLKGVSLQGTVAFRDQILIIPHMIDREPITQWKISVENESGDEIMSDKGRGNLPQRFVWNGKQKTGALAAEGIYQIVLKTWDRADNMGISSKHVMYSKTPPAMVLETNETENELTVDLRNDGKIPTAFWRLEMRSDEGQVLKVADGEDLPVRIGVPSPDENRKVECVVEIRDILGNRTRTEIKDLHMYARQSEEIAGAETEAIVAVPKAWLEEF